MLLSQIQSLIDAAKTTVGDLVTWAEVKTILEAHKNELGIRGIIDVTNTTTLQAQSGANTSHVLVTGVGLFSYSASGTANGTTIFNASGGGVWNLVLAPGTSTGGSTAFTDITGNALDNLSLYTEIFNKGLPKYATTADLATVNVTVSDKVIVPGVGILAWTATGPANGTTIFAGLGGFWQLILAPGTVGGASTINDLTDVAVTSPSSGQVLKYDGAGWVNSNLNSFVTLTDAATVAWNYNLGNVATVTLAGNRTLTLSNVPAHSFGLLKVKQDAVGGRSLTLPGNLESGFAYSIGANQEDMVGFYFDGTNYYWYISNFGAIVDSTPPSYVTATAINSNTIQIVFSEVVTATNIGWSFKQNGASITPTGVSGSGTNTLTFTFGVTLLSTDTLLQSYDSVTGNTQDAAGNELVSYADAPVLNNIVVDVTGWTSSDSSITIVSNTLTKINSTSQAGKAISTLKMPAGVDGYVEFEVDFNSQVQTMVLALDPDNAEDSAFSTIAHGIYATTTASGVIFNGAIASPAATIVNGHLLRIERSGTSVLFKHFNGTSWTTLTSNTAATGILYIKAWAASGVASTKLVNIKGKNVS